MRTILNTVGTSLLTNAARELGGAEPDEKALFNYLARIAPELASAETNALAKLRQEGDRLIFLHSSTEQGRLCAHVLCRHYRSQKTNCDLMAVNDLSYQESRFKMRGLRSLIDTMIRLIREEQKKGAEVVLNATGGFKAEIAYATLIGLLFDVPVYYIHEAFQEIIEMPPIPIAWDYAILAEHEDFFSWIEEEPRKTDAVDERLKCLPREIRFLLFEEEGFTYLSPTGGVFYAAFEHLLSKAADHPVSLSADARRAWQGMEAPVRIRFEREMEKLRSPVLRRSGSDQVRNCDCLVYPKGHRDERIFFFEAEETVYVCELSRHSNKSYERLIDKGVLRKNYDAFSAL